MKMKIAIAAPALALSAAVLLGACGSDGGPPSTQTPDPGSDPGKANVTISEKTLSHSDVYEPSDAEISLLAFEMTWDGMAQSDKDDICWAWDNLGQDWVIEEFQSYMTGEFYLNKATLRSLFSDRC